MSCEDEGRFSVGQQDWTIGLIEVCTYKHVGQLLTDDHNAGYPLTAFIRLAESGERVRKNTRK